MAKKTNKTKNKRKTKRTKPRSEWSELMDLSRTSKNLLPNTPKNRRLWEKGDNRSKFDIVGIDTKADKNSMRYKHALEKWRSSKNFKSRYGQPKQKSKEIIPDLWELETIPSELYGEFNNIQEYYDFLDHIEPKPKPLPKKKKVKKKHENNYNKILRELKNNYTIPEIFQNNKHSITIESILQSIGIDIYASVSENYDMIIREADIQHEMYLDEKDWRMKLILTAKLKKSRLKKSKATRLKREKIEANLPRNSKNKIILPNNAKNRKRLKLHPKLKKKYVISRSKMIIKNTKKNRLRMQKPVFARKHKLGEEIIRKSSTKERSVKSLNSRIKNVLKVKDHLEAFAKNYVDQLAYTQNWDNNSQWSYLTNLQCAIEEAVDEFTSKKDKTRISGDISEIWGEALRMSTEQAWN